MKSLFFVTAAILSINLANAGSPMDEAATTDRNFDSLQTFAKKEVLRQSKTRGSLVANLMGKQAADGKGPTCDSSSLKIKHLQGRVLNGEEYGCGSIHPSSKSCVAGSNAEILITIPCTDGISAGYTYEPIHLRVLVHNAVTYKVTKDLFAGDVISSKYELDSIRELD